MIFKLRSYAEFFGRLNGKCEIDKAPLLAYHTGRKPDEPRKQIGIVWILQSVHTSFVDELREFILRAEAVLYVVKNNVVCEGTLYLIISAPSAFQPPHYRKFYDTLNSGKISFLSDFFILSRLFSVNRRFFADITDYRQIRAILFHSY